MTSEVIKIECELREDSGKGVARSLRRRVRVMTLMQLVKCNVARVECQRLAK